MMVIDGGFSHPLLRPAISWANEALGGYVMGPLDFHELIVRPQIATLFNAFVNVLRSYGKSSSRRLEKMYENWSRLGHLDFFYRCMYVHIYIYCIWFFSCSHIRYIYIYIMCMRIYIYIYEIIHLPANQDVRRPWNTPITRFRAFLAGPCFGFWAPFFPFLGIDCVSTYLKHVRILKEFVFQVLRNDCLGTCFTHAFLKLR